MVDAITAPGTGLELQEYTNTSHSCMMKMGLDDGRYPNGTAVVDTITKYIVDGGIHPDLASGNNRAYIMVVAENE
ncbi:hypothetical protein BO99DRAFT_431865 [Aspergillus violaceofuscus CBS 115571]|uniref:Uncharacterized protein n=1 Tax=Aspergillus violaceofuscus (strain CBS 115571) TaxID=1450538 RepID=A0A2V5HFS9_ASPV1|nr:hypothetical protein BO99DRAFT_431865 [Aspergillus violaceofuscus CBS 115571]